MNSFVFYLSVYIFGGLTFVPLTVVAVLSVLYLRLPTLEEPGSEPEVEKSQLDEYGVTHPEIQYQDLNLGEYEEKMTTGVSTYATGWLTVTTEFYQLSQFHPPKEAENGTGADSEDSQLQNEKKAKSSGSSSTYSNLYKLVKGDKNGSKESPDADTGKNLKNVRKKNRYFAVLKHGNLFLYKDESCKNVQHVIVLNSSVVALWPRNLREGELFSKRTAICIMKKEFPKPDSVPGTTAFEVLTSQQQDLDQDPPKDSFFIYTDYNHEKEDWYFNLIKLTKRTYLKTDSDKDLLEPSIMAKTSFFKTKHMIDLIQTLNSSEGQLTTKWLNALMGRVFLGLHNTKEFHDLIKTKVEKKLMKIKKPGFLDDFQIEKINVGDSGPFLTFPKLNELSPEGNLDLEMNLLYRGGLSIQIATKANINLGSHFKTREVNLVLTVKLVKLAGTLVVRLKPPPSNRIWYSFVTMPELDLEIEPVVSSRQLTYNVVTKMIGNKFKEAIRESLVMPYMDEFPIFNTEGEIFRGGIWDKKLRKRATPEKKEETRSQTLANDELTGKSELFGLRDDESAATGNTELDSDGDDGSEEYAKSGPHKSETFPLSLGSPVSETNAFSKIKQSSSFNSGMTAKSITKKFSKFGSPDSSTTPVDSKFLAEDTDDSSILPKLIPHEQIPDLVEETQPTQTKSTENLYSDSYSALAKEHQELELQEDDLEESEGASKISKQMKKIFTTKNGSDESLGSRDISLKEQSKLTDRQNLTASIKKIGKWYNKQKDNRGVEVIPDEIGVNREKNNYIAPEMIKFRRERGTSSGAIHQGSNNLEGADASDELVTPTTPDRSEMFMKRESGFGMAKHSPGSSFDGHSHHRKPPPTLPLRGPALPPRSNTAFVANDSAAGQFDESPGMILHRKSRSSLNSAEQTSAALAAAVSLTNPTKEEN